jgi:hypothetical protein
MEKLRRDLRKQRDLEHELEALARAGARTRAELKTLRLQIKAVMERIGNGAVLIYSKGLQKSGNESAAKAD